MNVVTSSVAPAGTSTRIGVGFASARMEQIATEAQLLFRTTTWL